MPTSLKDNLPLYFKDPLLDPYHASEGTASPDEMECRRRHPRKK